MRRVTVALVHYPVLDRERKVVTTAITNLDLHDIARSAHTYGLSDYFIVHPVEAQRELAERVKSHWLEGSGARRIPDRVPAMERLRIVPTLEDARRALGGAPELWTTSAARGEGVVTHEAAKARLAEDGAPVLLVFGTGWGLADSVMAAATLRLEPIASRRADGYNHLSVRAAAAITLDRLLGRP
ncbi:MAG: RNA methyltransferase [Sorangiineae bacterium]|nr:RNA methyltransferase [Polyangiaceae bacterium]MEB2323804.1 RNA methyltransferase [Sorangiineae bacterium]